MKRKRRSTRQMARWTGHCRRRTRRKSSMKGRKPRQDHSSLLRLCLNSICQPCDQILWESSIRSVDNQLADRQMDTIGATREMLARIYTKAPAAMDTTRLSPVLPR